MNLQELFDAIKVRWPDEIDISKAELLADERFLCWELIRIEEEVSDSMERCDGLLYAAIWPFHQALVKISRELFVSGHQTVSKESVRLDDFEFYLLQALSDDSWAKERDEYRRRG